MEGARFGGDAGATLWYRVDILIFISRQVYSESESFSILMGIETATITKPLDPCLVVLLTPVTAQRQVLKKHPHPQKGSSLDRRMPSIRDASITASTLQNLFLDTSGSILGLPLRLLRLISKSNAVNKGTTFSSRLSLLYRPLLGFTGLRRVATYFEFHLFNGFLPNFPFNEFQKNGFDRNNVFGIYCGHLGNDKNIPAGQ